MSALISLITGISGLVMLYHQSQHDFSDTRRVYIAFALLGIAVLAGLVSAIEERRRWGS